MTMPIGKQFQPPNTAVVEARMVSDKEKTGGLEPPPVKKSNKAQSVSAQPIPQSTKHIIVIKA